MQIVNQTDKILKVAGFKIPAGVSINIHNSLLKDEDLEDANITGSIAIFGGEETEETETTEETEETEAATKTPAKAKPKTTATKKRETKAK